MKHFVQTIFCPPNDKFEEYNLESRLTDETFRYLKDMKINRILGWGWDSRESSIIKTLELCEKYDIEYYLATSISDEYVAIPIAHKGHKPFCELTKEELDDLDNRFINNFNKYTSYKALKGIIFADELGYLMFPGLLHAKEVFEKAFPGYDFYTNFLSYSINENMFWASFVPLKEDVPEELKPFKLEGKNSITFENRYNWFNVFVDGLLANAHFNCISFDKYPYEDCFAKTGPFMHYGYIDGVAFFRNKKDQYHSNFFSYIGAGTWFKPSRHQQTEEEFLLTMNINVLYGLDGFGYFPGFYPIDFVVEDGFKNSDNGLAGLIDINGKPTKFYYCLKSQNEYFSRIEDDILSSSFIGVKSYGKYYNGFTYDDIKDMPDNEVIYMGDIPHFYKMDKQSIDVINASNNVVISEFNKDNKKRFYLVNMSTLYSNDVTISLPNGTYTLESIEGTKSNLSNQISISIKPGQGVYLIED